jgi:hypothetical protein
MNTNIPSPEGLPALRFQLKYDYVVTRELVRRGTRVALTISADGRLIAERTTNSRYSVALICALDPAKAIRLAQQKVAFWSAEASYEEGLHRRDPVALQNAGWMSSRLSLIEREAALKKARFGERAKRHRKKAANYEARLARLLSGSVDQVELLCVYSWHQRLSLVPAPRPGAKMIDVLAITTGLP